MDDAVYTYVTVAQAATVTVRSGSKPPNGTKIPLGSYILTVTSSTPATNTGGRLTFSQNTPLTVRGAVPIGVTAPDWTYPFNVTTDSTVQVTQVPDP